MKKSVKSVFVMIMTVSLILIFGACGKAEPMEVSGTLTNAVDQQISVRTDGGPVVFKTSDDTVYDLGEESELTVGDVIRVKYHKSLGKDHVDEVTVLEHHKPTLSFEGNVVDIKDGNVTVTSKSLTVSFSRDDDTAVSGELKVGAEVEIAYDGDISEHPYATEVKVTKTAEQVKKEKQKDDEKKDEAKTASVSGIVSEFTEKTMLLAIDSATSYRFTLSKDLKVTGADKYVHTGDSVNVTFRGELGKSPEAVEINIVKKAQEERKTINGKINGVEKDYLTLNTGKKSYIIHTNKDTKYSGDKPAKGRKAEITYTGNLSRDAKAVNVYCVKTSPEKAVIFTVKFTDGKGNILSTQTVEKGKSAKAPKAPKRKGYTFKGWDKDFSKVTSDMTVSAVWKKNPEKKPETKPETEPEPEKKPEPEPGTEPETEITSEGSIEKWTEDGDNSFDILLDDGSTVTLEVGDFTEIASGYLPAVGDKVKVTYLKSDMKATKIELIEKAAEEGGDEPEPEPRTEPETVEPEPEPGTEPETVEPEPEPEPETVEPEPEPEPEPKEEPDVVVSVKGTIVKGDESKKTVTILIEDGKEITLSIDEDSQIASGYFPEKEDVVEVKYTKKAMLLKSIKLISRPEPPAAEEGSEPEE